VTVRVQARASRDEILGWDASAVRVRVTAPPVGGAANAAVQGLLADALDCPRSAVRIIRGHAARTKLVGIRGVPIATIRARLSGAGVSSRPG